MPVLSGIVSSTRYAMDKHSDDAVMLRSPIPADEVELIVRRVVGFWRKPYLELVNNNWQGNKAGGFFGPRGLTSSGDED